MEGVLVYIQSVVNRATRQYVDRAVRTTEATLSLSGLSLFKTAGYLELSVISLCNASIVYAGGEPRDAPVCGSRSQNNGNHAESVGRAGVLFLEEFRDFVEGFAWFAGRFFGGFADCDDSYNGFSLRNGEDFAQFVRFAEAHNQGGKSEIGSFENQV